MELQVNNQNANYSIIIQENSMNNLASHIDLKRRFLVITDDRVALLWADKVIKQLHNFDLLIIPNGEKNKNYSEYLKCMDFLIKHEYQRNDAIISLGGGVIGDLAGFVAATYLRGISLINIPTTSLSMVDSSIGGKVAINHAGLKNVIGSFYQPEKVIIDPQFLTTLDQRNYFNGLVEAIKSGLIADQKLYELFKQDSLDIEKIIYRSLDVKRKIVLIDPYENNQRKLLNFGHSIGHAIEEYYDLSKYLHGECVALGMLAIIKDNALKDELIDLYKKFNLPISIDADPQDILSLLKNDKKCYQDNIALIKLEKVGKACIVPTKIEKCLEMVGDICAK